MSTQPYKIDLDLKSIHVNPMLDGALRKEAAKAEDLVNKFDGINHNGIPDIQELHDLYIEIAPKVLVVLPEVMKLAESVDLEKLEQEFVGQVWVKDHAKLAAAVHNLLKLAEDSAPVIEKLAAFVLVKSVP